jgi:hypothetical protein
MKKKEYIKVEYPIPQNTGIASCHSVRAGFDRLSRRVRLASTGSAAGQGRLRQAQPPGKAGFDRLSHRAGLASTGSAAGRR